ncbi:hypothetical protein INR49_002425, partial [Caranx melampygus]
IEGRQQQLSTELFQLQEGKKQVIISAFRHPLSEREENFTNRQKNSIMQGKNEMEQGNNMHLPWSSSSQSPLSPHQTINEEEAGQVWRGIHKKPSTDLTCSTNLRRASSIKDLISKFSGPCLVSPVGSPQSPGLRAGQALKSASAKPPKSTLSSVGPEESPFPNITVSPPLKQTSQREVQSAQRGTKTSQISTRIDCPVGGKTQVTDCGRDSVTDSGLRSESEFDSNKQPDSRSEDELSTPKSMSACQNPKYQLFLNQEMKTNGVSGKEANGPVGSGSTAEYSPRMARWETTRLGMNHYRGSLESLASRDGDSMSDRGGLSPATSEMNLLSTSPVGIHTPTPSSHRQRFSTYDSLAKRRAGVNNTQVMPVHYSMRSATLGGPNRKDYIEELTKQLDACQRRNQFLEAESVEMDKERNQIRLEMRNLLVNREDLLRTNSQLNNELKRMREQMIEMERQSQAMGEKYREMEIEVKQARDVMVEANTQEYAFNFLQQSLENKIQDAEENLEKQMQHSKTLADKLWLAERQLEELELDKDTKSKRTSALNSTIQRLETELAEAIQTSTQAAAEMSLQQKLREDAQIRVEELEESLLEKDQEVSGKLIDKEQTLEEEIQLRERIQLQCKQAERTVEDLKMELQTTNQNRDDLSKQLKQAQEKIIDLESDLEELHDSEQRWAAKHKRAIEQMEQLQLKLIQEKDLNDELETEKVVMERQLRELHLEVEELQSSRVQEDIISRAESRVKELETSLRAEERSVQ